MDAVIKAQEFVCQTHREYLEKCGWSIEECGVEACFAYLYTQGIIDEDYERVVELENNQFQSSYEVEICEVSDFFDEEILPRKEEAKGEALAKWKRFSKELKNRFGGHEEIEALVFVSANGGGFDVILYREAV